MAYLYQYYSVARWIFSIYTDIFDDINIANKKGIQTSRQYTMVHLKTVLAQLELLEMEKNTFEMGIYMVAL